MHKRSLLLIYSICGSLLLSGCTDYKAMKEGVDKGNERVEFILQSRKENEEVAQKIEKSLKSSISAGKLEGLDSSLFLNTSIYNLLGESVSNTHITIKDYVDQYNKFQESRGYTERIGNVQEYSNGVIAVNYFLDDTNGKVEQMFTVRLPNGTIETLSLLWLGGVCCEVETHSTN